ncbi:MAG: hypothetical protein M0R38_00055 [Bacteroidia bacterium]|nr:hypothetical protein [Bacteroidia bacterium]
MTQKRINNIVSLTYWTIGLLPVIWVILVLTNYLITGNELGHLPKYGIDGGQESYPIPYSGLVNMILMMTTFWGIVIIPCIVLGHFIIGRLIKPFPKLTLRQALTSYIGCGLYLLLWNWKPFSAMMTWYID